ncbi:MAG: AAA family ATPase [Campylobacterota bacterium]|nr:AAA family ATPase [Campylobacterota bacterium]
MEQTLIGQIDRIIYENEGFFIAALKSGEKISGTYFESEVSHIKGAAVTLKGHFDEHKKYGRTFKFDSITINQNELFFFLNRVVKGFTKKLTADLIEKYGEQGLVDILDNDIERLLEMKGIKKKRLAKIQSGWKQFRSMRELGEFLSPYGVSPIMLTTIATAMKEVNNPIEKIKNNPYVLTSINGIGFKRADEIALKMGVDLRSEKRIGAAMDFILNDYCERQGNSCVEKEKLFSLLDEALEFYGVNQLYEHVLIERVSERSIMPLAHNRYAPDRLYEAEKLLYDQFKKRARKKSDPIVKELDLFLQESELTLGEEQRQAVEIINSGASLLFLVGYAGTGKSTTSRAILDLLARRYDPKTFITCALSGIASQRIADTTGYESATIQSLLVKYEDRDYMPYSVILIDESSMINSMLFARLFSKIDREAVVIIVGDDAQLPPIGAGNVLSDALTLTIAPIVKLTKIYRQSEDQAIALLANDVRRGVVPEYLRSYEDFYFEDRSIPNYYARKSQLSQSELSELREENAKAILARIVEITMQVLPSARQALEGKRIAEYLTYFQVIAPMKGGTLGVDNLNKVLQEYCNPNPKRSIKRGDREYRLMDKVVHIKNENMPSFTPEGFKEGEESSDRRIFNGMNGLLFRIDEEEEQLFVFYPNEGVVVQYEYEQLKTHLMLSYALTIHKVQGMEYHTVIMPMSFAHFIMLNTKLLYTAMTRAKKQCYIVGESQAFETACRRLEVTRRDTVMLELGS